MKKGFTLIELLAVIVILAVIALIATPMILNVVEDAKKGAVVASANGYLEALENYQVMAEFKNEEKFFSVVQVDKINEKISLKGDKPKDGIVVITGPNGGKISHYRLQYDKYIIYKNPWMNEPDILEAADKKEVCSNYFAGDEITLNDGSKWYVIDADNECENITLLSKYLINIETNKQDSSLNGIYNGKVLFDDNSRNNENNTYCQHGNAAIVIDKFSGYPGCNEYAASNGTVSNRSGMGDIIYEGTVTEDSLIKKYVDSYVSTLNLENNLVSAGLMTTELLEKVGCSQYHCNNITWVTDVSYYLQTKSHDTWMMKRVNNLDGSIDNISQGVRPTGPVSGSAGIRPVITIKKEALN